MSTKTKQVGGLFTHQDKKGYTYTLTYFVDSDDEATYTPEYGQDGDAAPFDFPADTFIYDWKKSPAADHFVILIMAHDDAYDNSDFSDWNSPTRAQRRFSIGESYFDPTFWGVRRATKTDTGEIQTEDSAITLSTPKKNIYGNPCKEGDWLFRDASESSAGSADYSQAPYTAASMATVSTDWIGEKFPTLIYTVIFYTNKDIMDFVTWVGVNGAGNAYFSPPSGCIPTGYTAEGEWRSTGTQVIEDAKSFSNVLYHSVQRTMILAPSTLVWDKDKVTGGLWTW
jgi:hypothetical protein